jgi:hypothetical protein
MNTRTDPATEWATHDANGRALIYPGPDGTTYRNGRPVTLGEYVTARAEPRWMQWTRANQMAKELAR